MAGAWGLSVGAYPRAAADWPSGLGLPGGAGALSSSLSRCHIVKRGGGGCRRRHCFLPSLSTSTSAKHWTTMASRRSILGPASTVSLADFQAVERGGRCSSAKSVAISLHSAAKTAAAKSLFQRAIRRLQMGAGSMNQAPVQQVLGPRTYNDDHIEKSVRLDDSQFWDNSDNMQTHPQFQVTLKPEPGNALVHSERRLDHVKEVTVSLTVLLGLSACGYSESAHAAANSALNPVYGDVGAVLEVGVQLLYLGALLTLLGVGSFLVVRQVLIKRELETAAKELQDRVRKGDASSLDYFELGAVMLRKKFYQLARKYLTEAIKKWDGSEQDLAQVYNALGYSFFTDGKIEQAISEYEKAVKLQPTYVTAWNNLADAYEDQNKYSKALNAYEEALQFDPKNKIASAKRDEMKRRVERLQGT